MRWSARKSEASTADSIRLAGNIAMLCAGLLLFQPGCGIRSYDRSARPDLILITVDTLRADHLEFFGYERATAPNLSKLARSGITFKRAVASAPWTLPSMASIHSGLYPSQHGAVDNKTPLDARDPTLASLLKESGYETSAVVSHVFVGKSFGFARGFDHFNERHQQGHDGSSSELLTAAALDSFRATSDAPKFLWVHYFDPHYSYERHPEYGFATKQSGRFKGSVVFESPEGTELLDVSANEQAYMKDVYDEEIAFTDHHIGVLIEEILATRRDRPAIFVVTADHGEAFLERGRLGHGRDLYDELIRVPLVIGGDIERTLWGLSIGTVVETRSIATTLLGFAGVDGGAMEGTDLVGSALGRVPPTLAFSEGSYARGHDQRSVSIQRGAWKLIRHLEDDRHELFNRSVDEREMKNLFDDTKSARLRDELLAELDAQISKLGTRSGPSNSAPISQDERKKLEMLGYLELGTGRSTGD